MAKCPVCKVTIESGQRLCGNCRAQIVWRNGQPYQAIGQAIGRVGGALTAVVWGGAILIVLLLFMGSLFK